MELPVCDPNRPPTRSPQQIRALAIAVQAQLVQLKVAAQRRPALKDAIHGIDVTSPGRVREMREVLTDPETLKQCSDTQLLLALHEAWGWYCLLCWAHETGAREPILNFALLPADTPVHCDAALAAKEAEVHALLWRLRHEQRRREGSLDARDPQSELLEGLARRIPAEALGKPAGEATPTELVLAACQHAGMLAVLRWLLNPQKAWADPALTHVAELPF